MVRVQSVAAFVLVLALSACDMYWGKPDEVPELAQEAVENVVPSAEALFERPVRTAIVVTAQRGQSLDWLSLARVPVRAEVLVIDPRFAMAGGLYFLDEDREIKSVVLDGNPVTHTVVVVGPEPDDEDAPRAELNRGQWVEIKLYHEPPTAVDERGLEGPDRFRLLAPVRDNGKMYVIEVPVQQTGSTWYLPSGVVGTLTGRGSIVNQRAELIASVTPESGVLRSVVASPYETPATDAAQ